MSATALVSDSFSYSCMSTSPELRVSTLKDCNVPPMSPLNVPKASGPATGSLTPKRRKLPLKTVVDPTEASWKDDIENQYGGSSSQNVIFSSTKQQPLSIGTPVAHKLVTGRRDMRRSSQSLVARLGASVSSPSFDISRHSIIPDLMPSVHRNMPLTPKSAARRVRFLDMEEQQQSPHEDLLTTQFPDSCESGMHSHSSDESSDEEEVNNVEQENPFEVSHDDAKDDAKDNDGPMPESTVIEQCPPRDEALNAQSISDSDAQNATKNLQEQVLYVDVSDDNVSDDEGVADLPDHAIPASKGRSETLKPVCRKVVSTDGCHVSEANELRNRSDGKLELVEKVEKEQQTPIALEIEQCEEKQKEQPGEVVNKVTDTTQHPAKSSSDHDSEDDDSSCGSSDSEDMESGLLALLNDRETSLARQTKAAEPALTGKCHSGNTLSAPLKITSPSKSVVLKKVMSGKKSVGPLKAHSHNGATHHMKFGSHYKPTSPPKVTTHHRSPYSLPSATWKVNATRDEEKRSSKENTDWIGHQRHRKSLLRKQHNSSQWIVGDLSADHRQSRKLSSKRKREPSLTRQLR